MKCIIYPQENNKLAIIYPIQNSNFSYSDIIKKTIPENTEYAFLNNDIKIDQYFFDAYEYKEGKAVLNLDKAKEIQKNKWREKRKKLFEKFDIEFMLALEQGDVEKQKIIALKKQELRDVTKIELPDDPEYIKEFWPNAIPLE